MRYSHNMRSSYNNPTRRGPRQPKLFKPKVIWAPDLLAWALKAPYETELYTGEEFRAELKLQCDVPPRFDGEIKCWMFDERDEKVIKHLLSKYWPSYPFEWGEKPIGANKGFGVNYDPTADDSCFRKLFMLAGRDICNKLWREALSMHHPDKGGDVTKAQDVNVAWTEIKRQLNW